MAGDSRSWFLHSFGVSSLFLAVLSLLVSPSGGLAQSTGFQPSTQLFTVNYFVGDPDPAPFVLTMNATDGSVIPFSSGSDSSWLTATQSAAATPATVTITVHPAGLTPATYNGTVTFSEFGLAVLYFRYTLVVQKAVDRLVLSNTALTFHAAYGNQATMTQSFKVDSSGQPLPYAVAVSSGTAWLTADSTTAPTPPWQYLTPGTLRVFANAAALQPGTYTGSVLVSSNHATNSPQILHVTLNVTPPPAVSASPAGMSASFAAGGAAPAAQTIQVSGNGSALAFTATATSALNWLAVSPSSGTTPVTGTLPLTVSFTNLGGLTPNQVYTGTIVVAGTGAFGGSTTIAVTLSVSAPLPTILSLTNAASYRTGGIAAGELVSIFGTALGPAKGVPLTAETMVGGRLPTSLGGVQVLVSGYPAALLYSSATQISAIVPYEINWPQSFQNVTLMVNYSGQSSNGMTLEQVSAAPGLFTADSSGSGPGAILNSDLSLNSRKNPAKPGDVVVLYLTGEGQTQPHGVSGSVTPPLPPFSAPILPPVVTIDGQPAPVLFYGEAPGIVAGMMQINVQIPAGASSGDCPVVVTMGKANSQLTPGGAGAVTVWVQQAPASPPLV